MSGSNSGVPSSVDSVIQRASGTFQSLQDGISSLSTRVREGESVVDIFTQGVNSGLECLRQPGSLFGQVKRDVLDETRQLRMSFLLTPDNPVFRSYAVCSGLLGAKLLFNGAWTAHNRVNRKVFSSPEDVTAFGGAAVNLQDPIVERIRRMHLNDIENFTPFFALGLLYVSTDPDLTEANILFRFFVAARLIHTVCYLGLQHQPGRFLACIGGWSVNAFLAFRVLRRVL